ncbi:MAG: hypothetical protein AAF355_15560 [Myxococcota bacterium]
MRNPWSDTDDRVQEFDPKRDYKQPVSSISDFLPRDLTGSVALVETVEGARRAIMFCRFSDAAGRPECSPEWMSLLHDRSSALIQAIVSLSIPIKDLTLFLAKAAGRKKAHLTNEQRGVLSELRDAAIILNKSACRFASALRSHIATERTEPRGNPAGTLHRQAERSRRQLNSHDPRTYPASKSVRFTSELPPSNSLAPTSGAAAPQAYGLVSTSIRWILPNAGPYATEGTPPPSWIPEGSSIGQRGFESEHIKQMVLLAGDLAIAQMQSAKNTLTRNPHMMPHYFKGANDTPKLQHSLQGMIDQVAQYQRDEQASAEHTSYSHGQPDLEPRFVRELIFALATKVLRWNLTSEMMRERISPKNVTQFVLEWGTTSD